MTRRRLRFRGTTLLELMVVIAMIGVFAGLAVANLQGLVASTRLGGAVHATAALLRSARSEAIARRAVVLVQVSGGVVSLRLCRARFGQQRCTSEVSSVAAMTELGRKVSVAEVASGAVIAGVPAKAFAFGPEGLPTGIDPIGGTAAVDTLTLTFSHPETPQQRTVAVTSAGEVSVQ